MPFNGNKKFKDVESSHFYSLESIPSGNIFSPFFSSML